MPADILSPISRPAVVAADPSDGLRIPRSLLDGPFDSLADIDRAMRAILRNGCDALPTPGDGATADRWKALATVAAADLSLAKIFESHTDGRAILCEWDEPFEPSVLLAVWAAENPRQPMIFDPQTGRLSGTKDWCSGAAIVDEGLLTAVTPAGKAVLVRVAMSQDGIAVQESRWRSGGIAAAGTASVVFQEARATPVGPENGYLDRPGFWHGAAGIAAVWYGGAAAVAASLRASPRITSDPHGAAHLGAVHSHLQAARALLILTAEWIDANPGADAMPPARTVRAAVELAATETLQRTGRALGAGPLCMNGEHAKRVADLEVFLRQSHAERDLAALGEALGGAGGDWLW